MRNLGGAAVRKKFASFDGDILKAQKDLNTAKAKVDELQAVSRKWWKFEDGVISG